MTLTLVRADEAAHFGTVLWTLFRIPVESGLSYGKLAGPELSPSFRPCLSSLNEFLDKVGNHQSTSTIEMDAVAVKAPAIDPGDFVGALVQHQSAESIAIERKKPELLPIFADRRP